MAKQVLGASRENAIGSQGRNAMKKVGCTITERDITRLGSRGGQAVIPEGPRTVLINTGTCVQIPCSLMTTMVEEPPPSISYVTESSSPGWTPRPNGRRDSSEKPSNR